jgi:hypothetical protein
MLYTAPNIYFSSTKVDVAWFPQPKTPFTSTKCYRSDHVTSALIDEK